MHQSLCKADMSLSIIDRMVIKQIDIYKCGQYVNLNKLLLINRTAVE